MSRFATKVFVEFRGTARRTEINGIERFLERCASVSTFKVQQAPGLLVVHADVLAQDVGHASEVAAGALRAAMGSAGWSRMNDLWQVHVVWPRAMSDVGHAA